MTALYNFFKVLLCTRPPLLEPSDGGDGASLVLLGSHPSGRALNIAWPVPAPVTRARRLLFAACR